MLDHLKSIDILHMWDIFIVNHFVYPANLNVDCFKSTSTTYPIFLSHKTYYTFLYMPLKN